MPQPGQEQTHISTSADWMLVHTWRGSTHNWERSKEACRKKMVWTNWAVNCVSDCLWD